MNQTSRLAKKMDELHAKLFKLNEKEKNAAKLIPPRHYKKGVSLSQETAGLTAESEGGGKSVEAGRRGTAHSGRS